MRALVGERWVEGFPDAYRAENEYRVGVLGIANLERLEGLFPSPRRDLRLLWTYMREIGPRACLRKVRSRTAERFRNRKFVSCGFGRVLETPSGGRLAPGTPVVFVEPCGTACCERIVLPAELVGEVNEAELERLAGGGLNHLATLEDGSDGPWEALRGWSPFAGRGLPPLLARQALKKAYEVLCTADWSRACRLEIGDQAVMTERRPLKPVPRGKGRPQAVLFGYGNYAKTVMLPALRPHLEVRRIHEIDPTQIPLRDRSGVVWDTRPHAAPGEDADVFLVAGYHHTHARLACEGLRRGARVVLEKPLVTSDSQLRELVAAMRETGGSVFAGFQRRYLPFNELARHDLRLAPGEPISYHAVAYEVPPPQQHWYRWEASGSRLVSNGCHWVDHFLFLNDFAPVLEARVFAAPDGSLNCSAVLANGAFFTLVLTHEGSRRLGVQDHVELRANGCTARIFNQRSYEAEDDRRVLRRARIPRLAAYRLMYDAIGRRIAAGEPGDSLESVQRSTELMLDLDEKLQRAGEAGLEPEEHARALVGALSHSAKLGSGRARHDGLSGQLLHRLASQDQPLPRPAPRGQHDRPELEPVGAAALLLAAEGTGPTLAVPGQP